MSKKNIIIFGSVLLVLIVAFWAVNSFWKPLEETEKDGTSQDGFYGDVPAYDESNEIHSVLSEEIVRIDVAIGTERFSFAREDQDWVFVGDETVRILSSEVQNLCMELSGIYANECIEENVQDLERFGLAEPAATLKIHLKDGTERSMYVGYPHPDGGQYYFAIEGNPNVYLVADYKVSTMLRSATAYRNTSILNVDATKLSRIRVTKNGKVELDVNKKLTAISETSTKTEWYMTSPRELLCNNEPIDEKIIANLSYITISEFIDKGDERYSTAGFNNPRATIELTDDNGLSQTIYVGNKDGDNCYLKADGRIYLISESNISFIDIQPFLYVSKLINLEHIDNVDKLEISNGEETHVATILSEDGATAYRLNGLAVEKDVFTRQIYQPTVCLLADDFAQPHKRGQAVYTISYYLKDGSVKSMTLYDYDDRNYSVVTETGACEFVVRKTKFDEAFTKISNIRPVKR